MARYIKKSKAWEKTRFKQGFGSIEVFENKLAEDLLAGMLFFGSPLVYLLLAGFYGNDLDDFGHILLLTLAGIVMLAVLLIYRPPRVIRVCANEQTAEVSRVVGPIRLLTRRYDLRDTMLEVQETSVISHKETTSGTQAALGCFLMLLGPLGALIAFAVSRSEKSTNYEPAFVLVRANAPREPLAVFLEFDDPKRLVDYYNAAWRR